MRDGLGGIDILKKLQFLKNNEEQAINTLRDVLSNKFNLVELRLFGSKVRGNDTPDSDIDVMIELAESNPEIVSHIYDILFEINLLNDTFISAIIFSQKEIEEGPLSESPIYKIIQKEGVAI